MAENYRRPKVNVLVKILNVSKIYGQPPNQVIALKDVSCEIKNGEFVAIIGPSGSGKSTLMNIIGCLDEPTSGQLLLEDKKVSALSQNELAKIRNSKIGFIFQSFNLLPRTSAIKNVMLPLLYSKVEKKQRENKAKQMLAKVGLEDKENATPSQLSGGQQQRVAIARALINDPQIILADEPTGNLDTKSSSEIMQILKHLNGEGKTIVIITHESEIAKNSKRIITLRDGQILSDKKTKWTHKK